MKKYSYETFPGQTIVRTTDLGGYSFDELIDEISLHGEGIVTTDVLRCDDEILSIEGLPVRSLGRLYKESKC